MTNRFPPKYSTIEIDWGFGLGWVPCIILSDVDAAGYCMCSGTYPKRWRWKLRLNPLGSTKSEFCIHWRFGDDQNDSQDDDDDEDTEAEDDTNAEIIGENLKYNEPLSENGRKLIHLSDFMSLPIHRQQIEIMIHRLEHTIDSVQNQNITPESVLKVLDNSGCGRMERNDRTVSYGESFSLIISKACDMYSLLKTIYYSMVDTSDDQNKIKFLAQPSILITVSDSSVVGVPHVDTRNIENTYNMVWCGYFSQKGQYLRNNYRFLNLLGRSVSTTIEPFTFDAKNEIHQICFDHRAPVDALRISVVFYHSGRRPYTKRVSCLDV